MRQIAENVWTQDYHLPLLGTEQGRVVTIIRLRSGNLVIHSTAPFSAEDVRAISALGRPVWLVEAMILHDTYATEGCAAFPEAKYLAPAGFGHRARPLLPAPAEWGDELEVLLIEGAPKLQEHVLFHRPSRTLIVADLVFHYAHGGAWERIFRRYAMGLRHTLDMTRVFRALISEKAAFQASIRKMLEWDFHNLIVGHKDPILGGAKEKVSALALEQL